MCNFSCYRVVFQNSKQLPVLTPQEKQTQAATLRSQFPVSSGAQHRDKESEWVPVIPTSTTTATTATSSKANSAPAAAATTTTPSGATPQLAITAGPSAATTTTPPAAPAAAPAPPAPQNSVFPEVSPVRRKGCW